MTGPEHYREAEKLLDWAKNKPSITSGEVQDFTAWAQVHATLALAAATALYDADFASDDREYQAWRTIAGTEATP